MPPVDPAPINVVEKPVVEENADPGALTNPPKDVEDDTSDFDFGTFSTDEVTDTETGDEGEVIAPATPTPATPAEVPPGPVEEPPAVASTPAPVADPAGTPAEPAAPAPTTPVVPSEPAAPQTPEPTSEEINQQYTDWFNRGTDFLAGTVYKLSDETKQALDSNPSEVMPRLAAQLHMQVLAAATTQAANLFATMLPQMQERLAEEAQHETAFYDTYKQLIPHKKSVNEIAKTYRAMFPNATVEEAVQNIAAMAMVKHQIVPPAMLQQQQVPNPVPGAVTPTSARGPAAPAPSPQGQANSWVEELLQEE